MKYKPKPCFDTGFLARGSKNGAVPLIGRLFPQPEVRAADRTALLDEFLGNHFALVSLPQTPASLFDKLPADLWPPLNLQRVAIRTPSDRKSVAKGVTSVFDDDGDFSRSMKNVPPGLALIRPDRYVAAYLPAKNVEERIPEVDEMIARTWK